MLEVNSWVLVKVIKTMIPWSKEFHMQTICDNYTSANLTKLAFSLLNTELCHLTLLMHEENLLQNCALRKAFAPNSGLPSYIWAMFSTETKRAHGENRRLDNHISNMISPGGKNFYLLGIKLHATRDYQTNLGRLWIFYYAILCHHSYTNDITLNAKNLSLSLSTYDKIDNRKRKKLVSMLTYRQQNNAGWFHGIFRW